MKKAIGKMSGTVRNAKNGSDVADGLGVVGAGVRVGVGVAGVAVGVGVAGLAVGVGVGPGVAVGVVGHGMISIGTASVLPVPVAYRAWRPRDPCFASTVVSDESRFASTTRHPST